MAVALALVIAAAPSLTPGARAQGSRRGPTVLAARSLPELRSHDDRIRGMLRRGELRLRQVRADKLIPGRTIERTDQMHRGVRVFGADVSRQVAGGQTVSVFGTLYDGIDIDTTAKLEEPEARARIEARTGQSLGPTREGELVVLPLDTGGFALTWRLRIALPDDIREYFVDAATGAVVFEYSDLQTQNASADQPASCRIRRRSRCRPDPARSSRRMDSDRRPFAPTTCRGIPSACSTCSTVG